MSGGIGAIRGFDYQATVILDLLFDHFDRHEKTASVRPEGPDDLDLRWTVNGQDHHRFVQIKKPREYENARPQSISKDYIGMQHASRLLILRPGI